MFKCFFKRKKDIHRSSENEKLDPNNEMQLEDEKEGILYKQGTTQHKLEDYDDLSFIVDYIGSDYISEAQSVPLLKETLKKIKKQHPKTIRVDLVLKSGVLKVIDNERHALLITAPLYAIALAAQEQLRGFETAFALNITRRRIHMCHVFQAGSRLEAAAIVRAIALSFRSVAKDLKEKQEGSTPTDTEQVRSNSSAGKHGVNGDSEFDAIAKRHTSKLGCLPTLPSEEDLHQDKFNADKSIEPAEVLVHSSVVKNSESEEYQGQEISSADLGEKAIQSIQQHDIKLLHRCIDEGLNVDFTDCNQLCLLHHAVLKHDAEIVDFLLEKGANANKEGPKDRTALHFAAAEGNRAITQTLLAHGANVRAKDNNFRTPLHLCASCLQSLEVSFVLVEHGARIEDNDIEGVRPVDLHRDLREMQNRLIQSNTEAFASAEIDRSRSNSNCSSTSGSYKSVPRSPSVLKRGGVAGFSGSSGGRLVRSNSLRIRTSSSLQSIQDVSDGDSLLSPTPLRKENDTKAHLHTEVHEKDTLSDFSSEPASSTKQNDHDAYTSDPLVNGYSSSMRRDSTTDSEFEGTTKEGMFSSDDALCGSESDEDSMKNMRDIIGQKTGHSACLGIPGSFGRIPRKNQVTTALDLLVTLSANSECQSSILAHLCLPKASQQLVNLAHSVVSNTNNLQQISKLLHNLFTVSGPTGRKKCIDAGLLKTVIDLLDAAEPVQTTCLSILNDLLQMDNERDYSGTMSGIPIEPLLAIIKNNDLSTQTHNVLGSENGILTEKPRLKASGSSDSGYPSSPAFVERSNSLRRKGRDNDVAFSTGVMSLPRSKSRNVLKSDHIALANLDAIGRGRSRSFSSSADMAIGRDSIFIRGGRNSDPETNKENYSSASGSTGSSGSAVPVNSRMRKFSRDSNSSMDSTQRSSSKQSPTNNIVARHVAMKMLAASSRSYKLQEELAKPQILKLLLDCLDDNDEEVILQAAATLANIAMNINTHVKIQEGNIEDELFKLIHHTNPRVQFEAARGLVYMGHLDVEGIYIYNFISNESVVYMEDDGKTFIRGTTVENLILALTNTRNIHLLWGGSNTVPPSPSQKKVNCRQVSKSRLRAVPSEYQIINFVLSTYQTFVHPIIFMRLLLHRFREPSAFQVFRNFHHEHQDVHMEHYAPLPPIHARVMRVWIAWLENNADDFVTFPIIKNELSELIVPMRTIDGPYAACASRLEMLLSKPTEININSNVYRFECENHHNILYVQCSKEIKEGKLPCSEDDFVYLAGLQLYIEDLCEYGSDFPERLKTIESITSSRLKQSLGSSVSSSKPLLKKVRSHYETFLNERLTERNAKHNYVDCCQGMQGYGCTFFRVKQKIPGSRSRKKEQISRLFGINAKRIVLLDERTKVSVEKFNPKFLEKWEPLPDSLIIKMYFRTKHIEKTFEMQLENRMGFKEISNHILTCNMELNFQGYQNIDTNPWSKLSEELGTWGNMALQLYTDRKKKESPDDSTPNRQRRCRSTTTTGFPMTGSSKSATVTSSLPKNYSASAPAKQESGWSAQEVLSFLNLRSILRRGDTIMTMPNSSSNSESGTPPKEGELFDSFSESPLSHQTSIMSVQPFHRASRVSNPINPEMMPMIDESGPEKQNDHSPADFSRYSHNSKMLICHCPPDADVPNMNLKDFSAFELLDHPKELARQITLIDHRMFCSITSKDVMLKISLGLIKRFQQRTPEVHVTHVEKIAQRFNQMSNWVVNSIVSERNIHRRAKLFVNFIETAKQCLELRNYNAVTAIVAAALSSAPIRRLEGTKELIPPEYLSWMHKMENLMDSRGNHKKYREALRTSPTPAVPYFGIYLKDLTFISDGNPDYLRGGVINLSKRRQVYVLLEEIHRFQKKRYKLQEVSEIKEYLLSRSFVNEDDLHKMSKENEPTIQSRLGSPTPPVSHYQYSDRRGSVSSTLFRYNSGSTRNSNRRHHQRSGTSATSV